MAETDITPGQALAELQKRMGVTAEEFSTFFASLCAEMGVERLDAASQVAADAFSLEVFSERVGDNRQLGIDALQVMKHSFAVLIDEWQAEENGEDQ